MSEQVETATAEVVEPEGPADVGPGLDPEVAERRQAALAQIRVFGDPVLKAPAEDVTEFDDALRDEAERMVGVMRDALGVGLAATQLGILHRMLVFQPGADAQPTALVNPRLDWVSNDLALAEEGCLSLPGVTVDVERPLYARFAALDPAGEALTVEASGLEARVIQHEMDHLDGVLILDRTTRDQRKQALRALREGTSYSPVTEDEEQGEDDGST
jgi:peptide deformylase